MKTIDFLYSVNAKIKNRYIQYLFWGVCNILYPVIFNFQIKKKQSDCVERGLIVSLTSFPARIKYVYMPICAILFNSIVPRKVVLWLSEEQFSSLDILPKKLLALQKFGLEIRLVHGDLKSHKKYYYAYQEFNNDLVLLIDDDLIYPSFFVANILKAWKASKKPCMVYNYGTCLYSKNGEWLKPQERTQINDADDNSGRILAGSGGGVLLNPSSLHPIYKEKDVFMDLTPHGDDYWLNALYRLSGLAMIKLEGGQLLQLYIPHDTRLWTINKVEIDKTISKLNNFFMEKLSFCPYPNKLKK